MAPIKLTRRQFLVSTGGSAIVMSLMQGAAPVQAAVTDTLTTDEFSSLAFFSSNHQKRIQWQLSNFLDFAARPAGIVTLRLTVDNRVLDFNSALVMQSRNRVTSFEPESTKIEGARTVAIYRIDAAYLGSEGTARFLLPLTAIVEYPGDNVDDPVLPSARIEYQRDGVSKPDVLERGLAAAKVTDVAAWGAAAAAAWAPVASSGAGDRIYRGPIVVRVVSTGPAPVPPGLSIVVRSDAVLSGSPALAQLSAQNGPLETAGVSVTEDVRDGQRTTLFVLSEAIAAGEQRILSLAWPATSLDDNAAAAATASVVTVLPLAGQELAQRLAPATVVDSATSPQILSTDVTKAGG